MSMKNSSNAMMEMKSSANIDNVEDLLEEMNDQPQ